MHPTSEAGEEGDALRLARLLRSEILRVHPKTRVPGDRQLGPWEKQVDRMLRLDNRTPEEVELVVRWLFDANLRAEASFVVLSAGALREKFDRIVLQMRRGPRRGGPRVPDGAWGRRGE